MTKTLTAIGGQLALVIDRSILDLLHIDKDTVLELRSDGRVLIVEPVEGSARKRRVRKSAEGVMAMHHAAFRNLAR